MRDSNPRGHGFNSGRLAARPTSRLRDAPYPPPLKRRKAWRRAADRDPGPDTIRRRTVTKLDTKREGGVDMGMSRKIRRRTVTKLDTKPRRVAGNPHTKLVKMRKMEKHDNS